MQFVSFEWQRFFELIPDILSVVQSLLSGSSWITRKLQIGSTFVSIRLRREFTNLAQNARQYEAAPSDIADDPRNFGAQRQI